MIIEKTEFNGLLLIKPIVHQDERGYFFESFRDDYLKKIDLSGKFCQDNQTKSKKGTLRGLHYQLKYPQGKLVRVSLGKVYDVAVDLRKNSNTFGKYFSCVLSERNFKSLYIPAGFAHGFMTLDKENYVLYSCTKYRNLKSEKSIKFNDRDLKIKWPFKNPIISKRDMVAMGFAEYKNKNFK